MKLNGLELNWNQWIAFCQSLRVKASLTNLLDVRHNYWSFLMKFSNYCSDMVMDVVNSNSRNRSCWHWWAECHVERQALPSKWETRLTRMQFNANTCIFISIKHFQTHQHPPSPIHTAWNYLQLLATQYGRDTRSVTAQAAASESNECEWVKHQKLQLVHANQNQNRMESCRIVWCWCCHSVSMAVHSPRPQPPSTLNYFSDSCRRHTWLTGFNMASITLSGRDCLMWWLDYCVININCPVSDVTSLIFRTS